MKNILVLGIGSRIMMDDSIGINIVEDLKKSDNSQYINYLLGETDFDYCFDELFDTAYLIIIDAYLSGKKPGKITTIPLNELSSSSEDNFYSMHGIHLLRLLQHAKYLPDGILIGIEPYEIDYGLTLSENLQSCYCSILSEVQGLISKYTDTYKEKTP